jgi:hypothetical protein
MAQKEEKYIVIKRKDLDKLRQTIMERFVAGVRDGEMRNMSGFDAILITLENRNRYVVVNQDEPYAEAVWHLVLAFETLKEQTITPAMPPSSDGGKR